MANCVIRPTVLLKTLKHGASRVELTHNRLPENIELQSPQNTAAVSTNTLSTWYHGCNSGVRGSLDQSYSTGSHLYVPPLIYHVQ